MTRPTRTTSTVSSSKEGRSKKPKPAAYPVASLLLDLRAQGIGLAPVGDGMVEISGLRRSAARAAIDIQTSVQVNKPDLLRLLAGRDACLRLGAPELLWWNHLEAVAGNGARRPISRPEAGAEDAPRLPDTWEDPPSAIPEDEPIAVDVETTTTAPPWTPGAKLVSVGFSALGKRWACPADVREPIQRYLALPCPKVFHNSTFDLVWLLWHGLKIAGPVHDTLWAEALAGGVGSKSLKKLSPYRYAVHYPAETPDLALVLSYNANDALATAAIYRDAPAQVAEWRAHPIYAMYSRMAPRLAAVSAVGIPLDQARVAALHLHHTEDMLDADARLQATTRLPGGQWYQRKAQQATGIAGTTDDDALREFGTPEALAILDWRRAEKNLQYLRKWCRLDRLRGLIKLNQAWTGRTASSEENLQNVPRALRAACGDPKKDWVKLDFAAAELVVAAVVSQCALLLEWFKEGRDPHAEAAARIFHKTAPDVTKAERAAGKVANFNLLYGGRTRTIIAKAAERGLVLSEPQAETIVTEFFTAFPEIQAWQEQTKETICAGRRITSPLGRTWSIPANSWHEMNQSMNAPIQATASDLTLLGLDRAWDLIEAQGQVVAVVHDSVEVVIPKGTFDEAAWREIAGIITSVDPQFPMRLEVAVGPSWAETDEIFTTGGNGHDG